MPNREGQFRLPGGMTIPLLAFLLSTWLLTHASLKSWLFTGAFMLAGFVFYGFVRRRQPD